MRLQLGRIRNVPTEVPLPSERKVVSFRGLMGLGMFWGPYVLILVYELAWLVLMHDWWFWMFRGNFVGWNETWVT